MTFLGLILFVLLRLEYWGTVYVTARLLEQGIPFHVFLEEPWRYLRERGPRSAPVSLELGCRPLLPRQMTITQALWKRWAAEDAGEKPSVRTVVETDKGRFLIDGTFLDIKDYLLTLEMREKGFRVLCVRQDKRCLPLAR